MYIIKCKLCFWNLYCDKLYIGNTAIVPYGCKNLFWLSGLPHIVIHSLFRLLSRSTVFSYHTWKHNGGQSNRPNTTQTSAYWKAEPILRTRICRQDHCLGDLRQNKRGYVYYQIDEQCPLKNGTNVSIVKGDLQACPHWPLWCFVGLVG